MSTKYSIGLDYGTNSVRTVIVNVSNGREVATAVWDYKHGEKGVLLSRDPNLARQHPADYVTGTQASIKNAMAAARRDVRGFRPEQIIGIGVDTTGSTPLPVDAMGRPLAFDRRFAKNPAAMAWLWKDHTGVAKLRRLRNWQERFALIFWLSAAELIRVNGFSARSCAVCVLAPRCSMLLICGWNALIGSRQCSPAPSGCISPSGNGLRRTPAR